MRSDSEKVLKHVLEDTCAQLHLENSNTRVETPASNGRGDNTVRAMKEMIQRQKDAVCTLGIVFSVKNPPLALLVRHSEWILSHLVRNDFWLNLTIERSRLLRVRVTLEILLRDQHHCSIASWSVDVTMTTNNHVFSKHGVLVWLEAQMK